MLEFDFCSSTTRTRFVLIALTQFATLSASLYAQVPAPAWKGTLRASTGLVPEHAVIELSSGAERKSAPVGVDGTFAFDALLPGQYQLSVSIAGTTHLSRSPVIFPAQATTVALSLKQDGSILVGVDQEKTSAGGGQLSSKAVSEIPLNKRDFSQLLLLAAGTAADPSGAANFTQQFAINGQRGVEATFALDGADISDPEQGGGTFTNFNVDAVLEIQSLSGIMPAEVGRGASGFTNIVTRSGTDAIHGSVFEFLRNSALDARNYFDFSSPANPGRIPPFKRNEFGFTNGGPVYIPRLYDGRHKFYYFLEYQGFRQVLGTTQVFSVPTAQQRAGVLAVHQPQFRRTFGKQIF